SSTPPGSGRRASQVRTRRPNLAPRLGGPFSDAWLLNSEGLSWYPTTILLDSLERQVRRDDAANLTWTTRAHPARRPATTTRRTAGSRPRRPRRPTRPLRHRLTAAPRLGA